MVEKLLRHKLDVVLCVNKPWEDLFRHEFRDMPVKFSVSPEPLGTSGEVLKAKNYITDEFLVAYSDDLTEIDYTKLIEFHDKNEDAIATLALTRKLPLEVGICNVHENRVTGLQEKPVVDLGTWTGTAVYKPKILEYCQPRLDFASDVLPLLIRTGSKVYAYYTDSVWFDIGSWGHYKRACETLRSKTL